MSVEVIAEGPAPTARRLDAYTVAIGAVALLALLVGALFFINRSASSSDDGAEGALKVASTSLDKLLTYTPTTVESDMSVEDELLTGKFKTDYTELVTTVIAPSAVKDGVTTAAEIAQAGVVSHADDEVVCLLFINMTTQSQALTEPRISGSRLLVTMTKVDGTWKVSKFDPV